MHDTGPADISNPGQAGDTKRIPKSRIGFGHILFVLCLVAHVRLATIGWSKPLLDRHGFRQCQTAISTAYMLKDGFRMDYSTPVLGRPWSIPFEFPLYQGIVAGLSHMAGQPMDQTGRFVSLMFFYLALVPAWFLLRHFLKDTERILIVLSLILASPVYIFWSRAFLIESLALCLSMSFLAFAIAALRRRDWRFIAAASAFGILAGLVKSTTFLVFCAPAGVALLHTFLAGQKLTLKQRAILCAGYGCGLFGPGLIAIKLWTDFADATKAMNPLAHFIISTNLEGFTFGTLQQRVSWGTLAAWTNFSMAPLIGGWETLLFLPLAMLLVRPVLKKGTGVCLAGFLAGPFVFTNLYAVHSYYWYASGIFLVMLAGLSLVSLLDLRVNKWALRLLLIPIPFAFCYTHYATNDLPVQRSPDERIRVLGEAVAACTGTNAVLLTYGFDFDSSLPYYSGRRALMAREDSAYRIDPKTNRPVDTEGMAAAVANLKDDPIEAMAVTGPFRIDSDFIADRVKRFGLSPTPIFDALRTAIYVPPAGATPEASFREALILCRYCGLKATPISIHARGPVDAMRIDSTEALVTPVPSEMVFDTAPEVISVSGSFGFPRKAYAKQPKTGGAEFSIEYQSGGTNKTLLDQYLDPADKREDRRLHPFSVPVPAGSAGKLYFRTANAGAHDPLGLTSWSGIELHDK